MEFSDFYDIAEYGNKHWKGAYSQKEVKQNAYDYYTDFLACMDEGELTPVIKELARLLADDGSDEAKYWLFMIASSLNLINITFADCLKTDEWLKNFLLCKENGYEKEDDGTALVGGYGTFCGNPYRLRTESL